jgi:hypothetical protein
MKEEDIKKRLEDIKLEQELYAAEMSLKALKANTSRSRSVTVGTAFGGTTEIIMRGDGDDMLWCLLQPVEVVELIHQLASNVGCHIKVQPRQDFASWRGWHVSEETLLHFGNHAPMLSTDVVDAARQIGRAPEPPEEKNLNLTNIDRSNQDAVATKRIINRKSSKRAPKTT